MTEIEGNLSIKNHGLLNIALKELTDIGLIHSFKEYYFLFIKDSSIVVERLKKEKLANEALRKSFFFTKIIGSFPFVECVCISGSLSKGVMEEDGDVDYFIITKSKRLWICRSLLVFFKKVFLLNSHKYFCVNYFIDINNLIILDENIFTATEISFLLPAVNYTAYEKFIDSNIWIKNYLPNISLRKKTNCYSYNKNIVKRFLEFILSGNFGEYLDNLFFKLTLKQWEKKFPHFNKSDFNLNLRTRKNVSKHHPRGYQQKVLQQYERQLAMILEQLKSKTIKVV